MYVSAHFCRVFAQGWNVRVIQHKRLQQVLPDFFFFFFFFEVVYQLTFPAVGVRPLVFLHLCQHLVWSLLFALAILTRLQNNFSHSNENSE